MEQSGGEAFFAVLNGQIILRSEDYSTPSECLRALSDLVEDFADVRIMATAKAPAFTQPAPDRRTVDPEPEPGIPVIPAPAPVPDSMPLFRAKNWIDLLPEGRAGELLELPEHELYHDLARKMNGRNTLVSDIQAAVRHLRSRAAIDHWRIRKSKTTLRRLLDRLTPKPKTVTQR